MDLVAGIVGEMHQNDVYTIAVAEAGEPGERTSISFELGDDFQEGEDTYCICRDPHQMAHDGGLLAWGLRDRVLVVVLDEIAGGNLEAEGGFRVDLTQLDEASVKMLEAGLTRVLVGVPRDDSTVDPSAA